jgi:hypothetical protein
MYDIVGDIHGHALELLQLLNKLGYNRQKEGHYAHPERKMVFVGDYIDRGPYPREVIDIDRRMVEADAAVAMMGNHEFNAICFHTPKPGGGYLRQHSVRNMASHLTTLRHYADDKEALETDIAWFKTLPLFHDFGDFRVAHACWNPEVIDLLHTTLGGNLLNDEVLPEAGNKSGSLYGPVEVILKGPEVALPTGNYFHDKDGVPRTDIRLAWWQHPEGKNTPDMVAKLEKGMKLDDVPFQFVGFSNGKNDAFITEMDFNPYPKQDKPVFFGHYWLEGSPPRLQQPNVCCLDYSIAKGGQLVAYRFDGEQQLNKDKFVVIN